MIRHFQDCLDDDMPLSDLLQEVLDKTNYFDYLDEDPESAEDRKNNINELSSMFIKYQEEDADFELSDFLEDVALVADIDSYNEDDDAVVLMTLHSAKGLEFPIVFIPEWRKACSPAINPFIARRIWRRNAALLMSASQEQRKSFIFLMRAAECFTAPQIAIRHLAFCVKSP